MGSARNVIAAVLKRLAHRNPNVQLYTLSLAESLSKNCTVELHRELASKAFTQALEKLITDRTTHEKVRRRALGLIELWAHEFENDPTLGIMEECYSGLKAKSTSSVIWIRESTDDIVQITNSNNPQRPLHHL